MGEDLFIARALNSLLVATGDLALLGVLFFVLRIRRPALRTALLLLAIVHTSTAMLLISPFSLFHLFLDHDGRADWYGVVGGINGAFFWLWAVGVATLALRRILLGSRLTRALKGLLLLREGGHAGLEKRVAGIAQRIGVRAPTLLILDDADTVPFVVGNRAPMLVFPAALLRALRTEEIEMILAHELAHIRHRDMFTNALLELLRTVLFFNPLLELLLGSYKDEREKMRDLEAARLFPSPRPLAEGLVKVLEHLRAPPRVPGWIGASTLLVPSYRRTLGRVRNLGRSSLPPSRHWLGLQLILVLLMLPSPGGLDRNSVRIGQVERVDGAGHHSRITIGAGLTMNPLTRPIVQRILAPFMDSLPEGLTKDRDPHH